MLRLRKKQAKFLDRKSIPMSLRLVWPRLREERQNLLPETLFSVRDARPCSISLAKLKTLKNKKTNSKYGLANSVIKRIRFLLNKKRFPKNQKLTISLKLQPKSNLRSSLVHLRCPWFFALTFLVQCVFPSL